MALSEDEILTRVMYLARGPIRAFEELCPEDRRAAVLLDDGISVGHWTETDIEALQWHRYARAEKRRREALS